MLHTGDCRLILPELAKQGVRVQTCITSAAKGRLKNTSFSDGLKTKDLIGIPWRVALALQADGWYLRQDIIWHKRVRVETDKLAAIVQFIGYN